MRCEVERLLRSYDDNGALGELTGLSEKEQGRFFADALRDAQEALKRARRESPRTGREIAVDASRLSGVNGHDRWIVTPDGAVRRELEKFPDVEAQLLAQPAGEEEDPGPRTLDEARPLLARAAYNGLWSPSGTNWQPIRSVELTSREMAGLMVLARSRYESILSDVARLCGIEQASHAEAIDLGIWLQVAGHTALSHGWRLEQRPVAPGHRQSCAAALAGILHERAESLEQPARNACEDLLASLRAKDHYPAVVLIPHGAQDLALDASCPGHLRPSPFDGLVAARSTQRVASPEGDLDLKVLADLWDQAAGWLPPPRRERLGCAMFSRHDEMPDLIGRAMHEGIEGPDGMLARIDLDHLQEFLGRRGHDRSADAGLPADLIPALLDHKMCTSGQYRVSGELLLDHRDRPVTPKRLVKLVRMLAKSFGRFFLSFQNTHPLLGVILTRSDLDPEEQRQVHIDAGRVVAHMTLLARARGLVSIIKSGPVEIARDSIRDLVADKISTHATAPLLTFQVGLPLSPDDLVSAGLPDEHTGLLERKLDKRAPRASLTAHYVPERGT